MSQDSKEVYVDGILKTWGDRLFYGEVRGRKGPGEFLTTTAKKAAKGAKASKTGGGEGGAAQIRQKLDATLKKRPEVMVKITGNGKSIRQVKNHLDYISRNGELTLEDQDGNFIEGKAAVRDLRDDWRDGRGLIPEEEGKRRETFNVVLSMPPGTDRLGVTRAARDFAAEKFGGRYDYVFATHSDDDHPHVHLVVKARGIDGKYLNPRKADLQKWRESFAEKLREHGIEANATKRKVRGVVKRQTKKNVLEAKKRGVELPHAHDPNHNPANPYEGKNAAKHAEVQEIYAELRKGLQASDKPADKALAARIAAFQEQMPATQVYGKGRGREKEPVREVQRPEKDR